MFFNSLLILFTSLLFLYVLHGLGDGLPPRTLGMYTLLADDAHINYTTNASWVPRLYPYQVNGFNVLWFTFINPQNMIVPESFSNLSLCRGEKGCPTPEQLIIFSIGGQLYSETTWPWLQTPTQAQGMAQKVAKWFTQYNIDGVDVDIEGTAGMDSAATANIIVFIHSLKMILDGEEINSIITAPQYGYPQIDAEISIVNQCWGNNGNCYGDTNSIGIMVYDDSESLNWVQDYENATSQYQGFPITVNVPSNDIIVGIQGSASCNSINSLVDSVIIQHLGGIMVWYGSVYDSTNKKGGLTYNDGFDASGNMDTTGSCWEDALNMLDGSNNNNNSARNTGNSRHRNRGRWNRRERRNRKNERNGGNTGNGRQ